MMKRVEFCIKLAIVFAALGGLSILLNPILTFVCASISAIGFISAWLAYCFRDFWFYLLILLMYYFAFLVFFITQWPPFGLICAGITTVILLLKLLICRYKKEAGKPLKASK
ncbi:MAG: hypothetical protein K2J67_07045 [Lachnospiraceae bacterium]|nr:hypothetical protein [Lachnospiraceae bacterium]